MDREEMSRGKEELGKVWEKEIYAEHGVHTSHSQSLSNKERATAQSHPDIGKTDLKLLLL